LNKIVIFGTITSEIHPKSKKERYTMGDKIFVKEMQVNYGASLQSFAGKYAAFEQNVTEQNFPATRQGVHKVKFYLATFPSKPSPSSVFYQELLQDMGLTLPCAHDLVHFGLLGRDLNKYFDNYLSIICTCAEVGCGPLGRLVTPQLEKTGKGLEIAWNFVNKDGSKYDAYLALG
jgi:hypothetical protein